MTLRKTFFAALCLVAFAVGKADTLLLDGIDASRAGDQVRPARGTSMERVEARFGTPLSRQPAVGDPPITRWEYPDFTVYFEHRLVIHAVTRR